jgi:hypothetical protein
VWREHSNLALPSNRPSVLDPVLRPKPSWKRFADRMEEQCCYRCIERSACLANIVNTKMSPGERTGKPIGLLALGTN